MPMIKTGAPVKAEVIKKEALKKKGRLLDMIPESKEDQSKKAKPEQSK